MMSTGETQGQMAEVAVEVVAKARRRRFTAAFKRRVLQEAAACTRSGEVGALLRREGLYSSHLTTWRTAFARDAVRGLSPQRRGPQARVVDVRDRTIADLQRRVARATARAERAEALVALQKKLSDLLGIALPPEREVR
jgi:transposase